MTLLEKVVKTCRWKKVSGCDYVGVLTDEAVGAEQGFVEVEIIGRNFKQRCSRGDDGLLAMKDKTTNRHIRKILTTTCLC